jgi:NAD(P)H dehydrogenase (quinone)
MKLADITSRRPVRSSRIRPGLAPNRQLGIPEQQFKDLGLPVTFLRPAWYMENAAWDVTAARDLAKAIPMVATTDVSRVAAELLQDVWRGRPVVELEGPRRISRGQFRAPAEP